jgi:PAS domain S-box-containing protein
LNWERPLKTLFSDERFRTVTETVVDGLIVIDADGIIQYVNPGCEKLFRYSAGALIGQNVKILMPSPVSEAHDGYLHRHRETRVRRIIGIGRELTGLRSDGVLFPMHLSVGESQVNGATIFVGIIYDLTEKKQAEETILHHQKLDAIGQLSGGIAHDFNNILSVIGGNLEMIEAYDLPPAAKRAIVRAQDATVRAARITQRLLAFARRQPLTRQAVDLNATLAGMADMLRRSLGETIEVSLALGEHIDTVETDIDQFETAVLNLAVNARDAMPNGGRLTIETENVAFEDEPGPRQEIPAGAYVRVSVSDTGIGMTPEVRERAIEPFFTTKEVGQGTGLGLSMVYGLLKQLGGHARIYSEVARGTRVSLFFPRTGATSQSSDSANLSEAPCGRGETILVVEDDADVRLVTVSRLESLGYIVRVATDAASALADVRATPGINLALVDVVMPGGMDGHTLADEIERLSPDVRIVLTSGYSPRMAKEGGAFVRPFLSKPSSRLQLATLIRSVLDGSPAALA